MPEEPQSDSEGSDDEEKVPTSEEAPAASASADDSAPAKVAAAPAGPLVMEFRPHDSYPPMEAAVKVMYCDVCGGPPDFCQYGTSWDKCKPWCMENAPQYYPELSGVSLEDAKQSAQEAAEKGRQKQLPGGKTKRDASPAVTIKRLTRGGRKCVTSVAGLDGFGVKLDGVAKLFKKKFSCGASVVKGDPGHPDSVDIQGDFEEEVVDLIAAEYKEVPREKITVVEGGTKKKGKR